MSVSERHEASGPRRISGTTAEREYWIRGEASEEAALAALLAAAPDTVGARLRADSECSAEEAAPGVYLGTAVYRTLDADRTTPAVESFEFSFDISGQNVNYKQALTHVADYGIAANPPVRTFGGGINFNGEEFEGVDVFVPTLSYQGTYVYPNATITDAFVAGTLASAVGSVNDDTFRGYAEGELLLTKISGQRRYDVDEEAFVWDVTFTWAVSKNKEDIEITVPGDGGDDTTITVDEKQGWDYLWVYYHPKKITNTAGNKYVIKCPQSAHVERVYPRTDYDLLQVPTS